MVAATIKKIHAPNQLAAVFEVSGSPDENFEYTFTPTDESHDRTDGVDEFRGWVEIARHHVGGLVDARQAVALGKGRGNG